MEAPGTRYICLTHRVYHDDETGQWVSECPELDVASCGDTMEEAFENITDAVELYLNGLEEDGELERIFRERSIRALWDLPADGGQEVRVHPNEFVTTQTVPIPAVVA